MVEMENWFLRGMTINGQNKTSRLNFSWSCFALIVKDIKHKRYNINHAMNLLWEQAMHYAHRPEVFEALANHSESLVI